MLDDIDSAAEAAYTELEADEGSEVGEVEDALSEEPEGEPSEEEAETSDSEDQPVVEDEEPTEVPDDLVEVEIDGATYKVPSAIKDGYLRQADYTRKTQELAQRAKDYAVYDALDRALSADPEATLLKLAKAYDIEITQDDTDSQEADDDEYLDPRVGQELQELRDWKAQLEARDQEQRDADLVAAQFAELDAVKTKYSAEFDEVELLQFAVDNQILNLEHAYILWERDSAPAKAATPAPSKKKVPPVAGGSSRQPKTVQRGSSPLMSLDESIQQAAQTHGIIT